jgi:RAD3-like DEAD/DEAH box helicase
MVESAIPSDADVELEFYEKFFIARGIDPYPVQEEAFARIFKGESVLVTVPTGTGKTLMAKAGILRALRTKKTAIYTTPLRALTEEKYRELSDDFGAENVGFATGDYRVNESAPIQVLVAEILWNRIYGDRVSHPADIVIMDEGHYFNDPERGYVWEQSIIGLHPRSQLIVLSATVGYPESFCQWVYVTRRIPMELVRSTERKVPLYHEYREQYLIEIVKELYASGDYPAIIFGFSREQCFERARLLRSCPRFTSDEEKKAIEERAQKIVLESGLGPELVKMLSHGIGIHHAGILPAYRRLVEELTLERLLKFVVTTETISAGINLPAKRVLFPSLRKFIRGKPRLLFPAEYHQMAGRAGRPQFDKEGIAITLAPEEVVQEFRKEIKDAKKGGYSVDEDRIKKKHYQRAKTEAATKKDVTWDHETMKRLVEGQPAALKSKTQITAEQILAIGLPDLARETLPGATMIDKAEDKPVEEAAAGAAEPIAAVEHPELPAYEDLNIRTVIDNLLLGEKEKREAHKRLAQITRNMQALGVLDEHGRQVKGEIIGKIRGLDGLFIYFALLHHELTYEEIRELLELLVDHDVIQKQLNKAGDAKLREEILVRFREMRRENPQVTWEDAEALYFQENPRELLPMERVHQEFLAAIPHPELHGGKMNKAVWAEMDEEQLSFVAFVEKHHLAHEEGSFFTYLARVMKAAKMMFEVSGLEPFQSIESKIRGKLAAIDERVLESLW